MSTRVDIVAVLQEIGEGIACVHDWTERRVSLVLLCRLGLLNPITQRIPACTKHHCPRCGQCEYEEDFTPRPNGTFKKDVPRSYRKFQLSALGRQLQTKPDQLAECVCQHPLFSLVQERLRQHEHGTSIIELAHAVLEAALQEIDQRAGRRQGLPTPYTRHELGAYLQLLEALGYVAFSPDRLQVRWLLAAGQGTEMSA